MYHSGAVVTKGDWLGLIGAIICEVFPSCDIVAYLSVLALHGYLELTPLCAVLSHAISLWSAPSLSKARSLALTSHSPTQDQRRIIG